MSRADEGADAASQYKQALGDAATVRGEGKMVAASRSLPGIGSFSSRNVGGRCAKGLGWWAAVLEVTGRPQGSSLLAARYRQAGWQVGRNRLFTCRLRRARLERGA